jgi:hypothetical protein
MRSPAGVGVVSRSAGGGHSQEGVGEHGQGGPAMPRGPAPNLVLVEGRRGLWRLGRIPRCASADPPRRPGCAAGRAWGCSSAGRRVRRWRRCAGSANVITGCRRRLRPAAETTPRSTSEGGARQHRRNVSARHVPGSAPVRRRRGSGRHGWVHAGWPPRPIHSPGHDRGSPFAVGGRRHRLRRRPPHAAGTFAVTARSIRVTAKAGLVANPAYPRGLRHPHSDLGPRSTTWVDTVRGRSWRARAVRVGQVHRDLRVLDAARGAAVLALHPDAVGALLDVASFVDDQDRTGITEGVDNKESIT